jgi:hypothetical protein
MFFPKGCVAKNKLGHKNTERYFSSGGNLEEIGHESSLPLNVVIAESVAQIPTHGEKNDFILVMPPFERI